LSVRDEFESDPRVLFVGPDVPDGVDSFEEVVDAAEHPRPSEEVEETDISLMLYTSGTTGRPKGVPRSQRAEHAATIAHIVEHRYALGERTLGVMPLFHTMGMHSLTAMLALNGLFVAMPEWDAERALEVAEREQLTCLYLIPTLFHELVNHEAFKHYNTSSVRKLGYAGASMLSALVEMCIETFQPDVFVNHYGSTEVYIFATYPDPQKKPGCSGRAAFLTELRVVRADPEPVVGPDEVVSAGETGEIIVRLSDDAFDGYYNRPEATEKAIRDGWYFTSDTGYLDDDGDLWVAGRVDDMINTGGENVYPVEVEDVLDKHPEVSEVAVVGLPDEKWGQAVTAFVVPERQELTEEDIRSYLKEDTSLARFKHPKKVVFVKELPKSPVGKLLRRLLVEGEYEEVKPSSEDAEVSA
jgi:2-furoate---CoA ligase